MDRERFISLEDASDFFNVAVDLLREWAEYGLIAVWNLENSQWVAAEDLREIRRVVDLYGTLGVNKEGIEIILALRRRILAMGEERDGLRRRLEQLERERRLRDLEIPRETGLIIDYFETRE